MSGDDVFVFLGVGHIADGAEKERVIRYGVPRKPAVGTGLAAVAVLEAQHRIAADERFEGFMQTLGKRLATGDRFLKELSRDVDTPHDHSAQRQAEADGNQS